MTLKTTIKDGNGTNNLAQVTNAGELIVNGIGKPQSKFQDMDVVGQAFNFFKPLPGFEFYITSIMFNTPGVGATIDIYEASSSTSTTIDKQIIRVDLDSKGFFPIIFPLGGFLPVSEGAFVNATTTNKKVNMTIVGFYKPVHNQA